MKAARKTEAKGPGVSLALLYCPQSRPPVLYRMGKSQAPVDFPLPARSSRVMPK